MILGTFLTAVGACVKMASVGPSLFWVTFIGQTMGATAQVFMLSVPPVLAAIWFGAKEVSTACAIGVFGNLFGIAMGFLLPPLIVKNHDDIDEIGSELAIIFYSTAGFSTAVFLATVIFFQARPPTPPSLQQAQKKENALGNKVGFLNLIRRLATNRGYILVAVAFAINQGVTNAVATLMNQLVLIYFKGGEAFAGRVGVIAVLGGMVGGVVLGILLDKTHKFKEITLVVYTTSIVAVVLVTIALEMQSSVAVYITAFFLGLFLPGYMPTAYEFGAELSYPEPEGMTAGILTIPTQISSALFVLGYGEMLRSIGAIWSNAALCACLVIGVVCHIVIRPDLKRYAASRRINMIDNS